MEIVASMTLSEAAFAAIKPVYVEQVLARLRQLAGFEAAMLFSEFAKEPTIPLPIYSQRISFEILRVGRALDVALDGIDAAKRAELWACVSDQLMPAIFDALPAARIAERLPWPYQKNCISSGLASRLVYREGLQFVEALADEQLASFAFRYLQQERRVKLLAGQVASCGLGFASEVYELLLHGGVRTAADLALTAAPK